MKLKKLYIKCPHCNLIFQSGFQAESVTQLIEFSYLCWKCRRIVTCPPSDYLEKTNEGFERAMKKEEIFALPVGKRIELMGPDVFDFSSEFIVKPEVFLSADRAIIRYKQEGE
ncbi:MAG: hypothetical protein ABSB40_05040 [Nitrososphaeria archaeon]